MILIDESQVSGSTDGKPGDPDAGFLMAMFGLLLIPIVIFTALAVDVSSWYNRATELQRSADAAALAGVVWMPDLGKAKTNADPVLERNGVVHSADGMEVSMSVGETGITSFKVCVTDTSVTQFFGVVFSSPTEMTRCGTAQYNAPLQLGSPLNYFGGNHDMLASYVGGTQPANVDVPTPDYSDFRASWYSYHQICLVRTAYPGGSIVGYWNRHGSDQSSNWRYYHVSIAPSTWPDCNTRPPAALPDRGSFGTRSYCRVMIGNNQRGHWEIYDSSATWPNGIRYRRSNINNSYPICGYDGETRRPIPAEKSPNMWAAIESYNYGHANGDAYSNAGAEYDPSGYWYSVDVPDSGVNGGNISIQVWDLTYNCKVFECRSPMGDASGGSTGTPVRMRVFKAGTLKYDMSAITEVPSCDTGWLGGTDNGSYDLIWAELCNITTASPGNRYYIQVQSTDENGHGTSGRGVTGYAVRAVSGSYPAECLEYMPEGDVACYGTGTQPRLSAYGRMEMYNGIDSGQPTQFYLADVTPSYGGKTLEIKLFDPGDGAGSSWVTVRGPSTSTTGGTMIPASACTVHYRNYGGSTWSPVGLSNGPDGNYPNTCTVQTTTESSNTYNDRWLRFRITLPSDYGPEGTADWTQCNPNVADPVTTAGSCWWQISYYVGSGRLGDYTTWEAGIINDPVRLVR